MSESFELTDLHIQHFRRCFNKNINYWDNYTLYGPANPKKQNPLNPEEKYVCKGTPTGVCHMMTCKCLLDDFDDIKGNDWFTGYCLECNVLIDDRSKAWRSPNLNGSFHDDCYCKYEHMELQYLMNENDPNIPLIEVMKILRDKFKISIPNKFEEQEEKDNFDI